LALAALVLTSCTSVEIEDHSLQFNQATGSLGSRIMLLNVVRSAKGYPVQYSKVTSYQGNSRTDGGVNLNFPFLAGKIGNPNTILQGGVTPSATFKTGVQNLQLADLNTAEIQRTLRKPVTPRDFVYYRSQGWPKALVNTVLIEELLVQPSLITKLGAAAASSCRGSGGQKFPRECAWLRRQSESRACHGSREERASPEGDIVQVFANSPRKRCQHASFQWFFTALRVLPAISLDFDPRVDTDECTTRRARLKDISGSAKDGKGKSKDAREGDGGKGAGETVKEGKVSVDVNVKIAEKADKDDDGADKGKDAGSIGLNFPRGLGNLRSIGINELPTLEALRNEHACLLKEGKTPIIIGWRSPERMVRYLGDVVAAQGFGSGDGLQILNDDGYSVDLFHVETGRDLSGRTAAVSVEGPEGETFFIPIPARASHDAHLSLQTLALVMESFNLAVSGKALPTAPTLFLSGG
jgi:hypothetical protein